MQWLGRRAHPQGWSRDKDQADFFRPEIIFGHVGKATKAPDPPWIGNVPTGFLIHLTMQCADWRFTGVYTATGKLQIGVGVGLTSQKQLPVPGQERIGTDPSHIGLAPHRRSPKASYHRFCPYIAGYGPYIASVCQSAARKETP